MPFLYKWVASCGYEVLAIECLLFALLHGVSCRCEIFSSAASAFAWGLVADENRRRDTEQHLAARAAKAGKSLQEIGDKRIAKADSTTGADDYEQLRRAVAVKIHSTKPDEAGIMPSSTQLLYIVDRATHALNYAGTPFRGANSYSNEDWTKPSVAGSPGGIGGYALRETGKGFSEGNMVMVYDLVEEEGTSTEKSVVGPPAPAAPKKPAGVKLTEAVRGVLLGEFSISPRRPKRERMRSLLQTLVNRGFFCEPRNIRVWWKKLQLEKLKVMLKAQSEQEEQQQQHSRQQQQHGEGEEQQHRVDHAAAVVDEHGQQQQQHLPDMFSIESARASTGMRQKQITDYIKRSKFRGISYGQAEPSDVSSSDDEDDVISPLQPRRQHQPAAARGGPGSEQAAIPFGDPDEELKIGLIHKLKRQPGEQREGRGLLLKRKAAGWWETSAPKCVKMVG